MCTLGAIVPNFTIVIICSSGTWIRSFVKWIKRGYNPIAEGKTAFHSFAQWLIPSLGVNELEKVIVNIWATIENIENRTIDAIQAVQEESSVLSKVVLPNQMSLDILLASQGGVCSVINDSGCSYIDQSGRVATDLKEVREWVKVLRDNIKMIPKDDTSWGFEEIWKGLTFWLTNLSWLRQLFIRVIMLTILIIVTCISIQCFLQCCKQSMMNYEEWKRN